MSDLRTRLERIGDRARPAPDAFAKFEGKRRRRERNRRVSAGVVAFVVAAAGSIGVFSLVGDDGENVLGGGEVEFLALWPESTLDAAEAFQQRVDEAITARGPLPEELAWRLDPDATALRFVNDALGWPETEEELAHTSTTSSDGTVTVDIVKGIDPGPCQRPECAGRDVILTLRQPLPGGGIWSVVAAQSAVFNIALHVNEEVEIGADIKVAAGFEDGIEVAVGFAGTGSCDAFHEETVLVTDLALAAVVPEALGGCTGYVYAVTPATPVGQVELGRIMFAWNEPRPALDYTITAITATPVRFIGPAGEPPSVAPTVPDALHVTCDRGSISVDASSVTAQSQGVHVVVENTSGDPLFFQLAPERLGPWGGVEVQPEITEIALQAPPGTLTVRCSTQGSPTDEIAVEVLDPQGLFVPFTVTCPGLPEIAYTISVTAWQGSEPAPDPVEFVRSRVEGLLPSDIVEHAGYPEAPNPAVRVVRDGAVVAGFELYVENGQWRIGGTWCAEMGIAVPPGPDPYPRGAFEWCPAGPFPEAGFQWRERASEAAVQFVYADMNGEEATINALLDESVPPDTDFPIALAEDVAVVIDASAAGGELVRFGCGPDVDAYTVAITIDDGTDSASMDSTVFLVFRGANGWKVWGMY